MKQVLLYLSLFCSCALMAQEQKYILLDSLTAKYKVKHYTLDTSPYGVKNTIEVYNVFLNRYDKQYIILLSVLPDLASKANWEEIDFSLLQKNFLPTKKLFDRAIFRKNRKFNISLC